MQWKIDGRSLVAAALLVGGALLMPPAGTATAQAPGSVVDDIVGLRVGMSYDAVVALLEGRDDTPAIETAEPDRKSVESGKGGSGRVEHGGRRYIKKKQE